MALDGLASRSTSPTRRGSRKFRFSLFREKNGIFRPKTVSAGSAKNELKFGIGVGVGVGANPNRSRVALSRTLPVTCS